MKKSENCKNCKYFKQTGHEDSGLNLPDCNEKWVYPVGICSNTESVHYDWDGMADWNGCYLWKKGR